MKRLLLFFSLFTPICHVSAHEIPAWLHDAVVYHIYPSSFSDSNGDGIGDIEGIRRHLGYIKDLGANTIWISPVFESPFEDGGYDITDYYCVDPRFGTNADIVRLTQDAHALGIRVCLDLVAGHTSDKHPWFRQSTEKGPHTHYADYYIWTPNKDQKPAVPKGKWVDNNYQREGFYLKNYYDCQPALNYGYANPDPAHPWEQGFDDPGPRAVRRELKNIMAFWFDKGIDGFRVDMAKSLVKNDPERKGIFRLWDEIVTWQEANFPETILLAEWAEPEVAIPAGFDIDLIIHNGCGKTMYRDLVYQTQRTRKAGGSYTPQVCYFEKEGRGQLKSFMEPFTRIYTKIQGQGYASMPISSHDTWRLNRLNRNTPNELKSALTFFLTMPWVPVIYYGEEIGMRSLDNTPPRDGSRDRAAERTPMQWTSGPTAGFSTGSPDKLYLPIDPSPEFPNVEQQNNDPNSILAYVRDLLALRKNIPALGAQGDWRYIGDLNTPYPMIYERSMNNERYWVIVNPCARTAETIIPVTTHSCKVIFGTTEHVHWQCRSSETHIQISGCSAAICRID